MINIENLSVRYGSVVAVRDVTLAIPQGHVMAVVGPSGSGKTSFLNALNRMTDLIPGACTMGRVTIDGCDIRQRRQDVVDLRRRVGMIFQKPNPFPMSIRSNIQMALREHGQRRGAALDALTEQSLRDVGLWDEVKDRLADSAITLSGGQQQRLCIARALALQPSVLLMDEPCSALDPAATQIIEDLIHTLRGRLTIVIVTHHLAQACRVADSVAVFWSREGQGCLLEYGAKETVFKTPSDPTVRDYLSGIRG